MPALQPPLGVDPLDAAADPTVVDQLRLAVARLVELAVVIVELAVVGLRRRPLARRRRGVELVTLTRAAW